MKKTILFSPVGMTDPSRFFHDGALLNIARHYKPDVIYLYMSKEVVLHHKNDNRYVYTLEKLGELIGKEFEIKTFERPELDNVQLFDYFIEEYTTLLNEIHNENVDADIILNVSSGTPAMKSSLQILSLTLSYKVIPIQVTTPQKMSNPRIDNEEDASPEELWELNESNIKEDNRCLVSTTKNLFTELQKHTVIKMLESYNYVAAYEIASSSFGFSDEIKEMLEAACHRMKLEYRKANTLFSKHEFDMMKGVASEFQELSEYLLLMKIKLLRHEYADFIRAITPAFVVLCGHYLRKKCNFDVENYLKINSKEVRVWDKNKLNGTKYLKLLEDKYNDFKDMSPIYSDALCWLIENLNDNINALNCVKDLRENVEVQIRNTVAHQITPVTDEKVKKITGFSSNDIFKKLVKLCQYTEYAFSEKAYDRMNEIIIEKIRKS